MCSATTDRAAADKLTGQLHGWPPVAIECTVCNRKFQEVNALAMHSQSPRHRAEIDRQLRQERTNPTPAASFPSAAAPPASPSWVIHSPPASASQPLAFGQGVPSPAAQLRPDSATPDASRPQSAGAAAAVAPLHASTPASAPASQAQNAVGAFSLGGQAPPPPSIRGPSPVITPPWQNGTLSSWPGAASQTQTGDACSQLRASQDWPGVSNNDLLCFVWAAAGSPSAGIEGAMLRLQVQHWAPNNPPILLGLCQTAVGPMQSLVSVALDCLGQTHRHCRLQWPRQPLLQCSLQLTLHQQPSPLLQLPPLPLTCCRRSRSWACCRRLRRSLDATCPCPCPCPRPWVTPQGRTAPCRGPHASHFHLHPQLQPRMLWHQHQQRQDAQDQGRQRSVLVCWAQWEASRREACHRQ